MKHTFIVWMALALPTLAAGQEALTLEQCRQLAIANNKELKVAEAQVDRATQERRAARTKYFPQLSATGTYMHNSKSLELVDYSRLDAMTAALMPKLLPLLMKYPKVAQAIPQLMGELKDLTHVDIRNIWIGDVSLVQPVFMGGKIISYNQITAYARELAESMHDAKLQDVICRTDETYWQVVSLANKKKLAGRPRPCRRPRRQAPPAMTPAGVATKADGLSVKVKLNEAEMAQTKVNNGLALSRMLLAQLCGLDMEQPPMLADERIENFAVQPTTAQADATEAFAHRPELKSLELATKIYHKKEQIALAEMLPTVALTANYLISNPNAYNGFKKDFAGMYNVGVLVRVPLSAWWEGTYKRNAARAEVVAALDAAREVGVAEEALQFALFRRVAFLYFGGGFLQRAAVLRA